MNNLKTAVCPKCDTLSVVGKLHSKDLCGLNKFVKEAKKLEYVQMAYSPDTEAILAEPHIPNLVYRWPLDGGNITYVALPRWATDAIIMYHNAKYTHMTLTEFMEKMNPAK